MSTSNIMQCRHCEKYIGNKINLDEYFFWCNKECYEANEAEIRERNLESMRTHHDRYKGKEIFGMGNGTVASSAAKDKSGNIIDNVIDSSKEKEQEDKKKTRKPRSKKEKEEKE